jgi:hypothetical protein
VIGLPPADVVAVELDGPRRDEPVLRYLVYLGAGYVEADRVIAAAADATEAFDRLHRLFGAVGSRSAVLRFHYSEQARGFAEETRARAAPERMAGAYEGLVEKMEAEIALREERVRNLEATLER